MKSLAYIAETIMDFRTNKHKQINLDLADNDKPFNRYDKIEIEEIQYIKTQITQGIDSVVLFTRGCLIFLLSS